jgi:hypothetical protein
MVDDVEYDTRPQMPMFSSPLSAFAGAIQQLTDPEQYLGEIENVFRGVKVGSDGESKRCGTAMLNEEGINSVMGQIRSIVSQTTIMSNLNDREVYGIICELGNVLSKDLMVNARKYAITDSVTKSKVVMISTNAAYICMKRGFEEGDKRFWKGTTQEITQRIQGGNQGFFKGLFGGGK